MNTKLHEHNIIHLGIQPHNIFINPKTKQIKLTNFSNSVRLQMKTQIFAPQEPIQSSLFYISPEQTGQVGSSIDYRTDFYSLGITFYEILTGRLPFLSDDSTELVYAHIAKVPAAPDSVKKKIPKVISEIVMKLLSKPAAERYRSASGLKADLEKCRRQLKETGTIEKFPIGEQDNLERFQIPEKLYGREDEQDVLLRSSKE
jgi:serine/threonine protein kinase